MSSRHFPVRPNLEQLRHQAKDLLRSIRRGDAEALADLKAFHPNPSIPLQSISPTSSSFSRAAMAFPVGLASSPHAA